MTVTVDQSLPVGVLTLRSFKMRAIARGRLALKLGEDRGPSVLA